MGRYHITGGRKLFGELEAPGAKNSALPILAASLLPEGPSVISGVPSLTDVYHTCEALEHLGCRVKKQGGAVTVDPDSMSGADIPDSLMKEMRSSILFLGAVLAKRGAVTLSKPGGCALGARPIDLHLEALSRMGAHIAEEDGRLVCSAPGGLHGADIRFGFPSVGATENVLIAASTAKGGTLIHNAAMEPEIEDLADYLRSCGARIKSPAAGVYMIEGVEKLRGHCHRVIPDRIAAGTFLMAAAAAGGELFLRQVRPEHFAPVSAALERSGCEVVVFEDSVYFKASARPGSPGVLRTQPYPGFPTDAAAPLMALAAAADGISVFVENIFESRFHHVPELIKMGGDIRTEGRTAVVRGVPALRGAQVEARDLRGGAALVIAGLAARGETYISGVNHIERGYEDLAGKLRALGAEVETVI